MLNNTSTVLMTKPIIIKPVVYCTNPKVLVVVAISVQSHDLWQKNMDVLKDYIDLYACLYDSAPFECINLVGKKVGRGCKAEHWYDIPTELIKKYDYVWVIDEDISFEEFNAEIYFNVINSLKPLVIQPSVKPHVPNGRSSDWIDLQYTEVEHDAEEVLMSEVQVCMVSVKIWNVVRYRLSNMDRRSIWRLDKFWSDIAWGCKFGGLPGPLVVKSTSVIHYDFRSMDNSGRCVRKCIDGCGEIDDSETIIVKKYIKHFDVDRPREYNMYKLKY